MLAYLYLPGEFTAQAEALLQVDPEWTAPVLWRSEFRNILAGYIRRGSLTFDQAASLQREAEDLMRDHEFELDSVEVLQLVRDSDCSAYDCEFVAVAMKLAVKLVTMDKKLLRDFPNHCASLSAGFGKLDWDASFDYKAERSRKP